MEDFTPAPPLPRPHHQQKVSCWQVTTSCRFGGTGNDVGRGSDGSGSRSGDGGGGSGDVAPNPSHLNPPVSFFSPPFR